MGDLKVLVVDDHVVFTELLSFALDAQPGIRCVGQAGGVSSALELSRHVGFDAAIVDVQLSDGDGLDLAHALIRRSPQARVVCLTAQPTPAVTDAARGYGIPLFSKADPLAGILAELRLHGNPGAPLLFSLTPREYDVAGLLREGLDSASIARGLGISVHTVREHIKSILRKTNTTSQLAAVAALNRSSALSTATAP